MVPSKLFKMRSISRHNTSLVPRHSKSLEVELAQHRLKYYQQTQTFRSRFCLTAFGSLYSNSPPYSVYSAYAPLEQFSSWPVMIYYGLSDYNGYNMHSGGTIVEVSRPCCATQSVTQNMANRMLHCYLAW